MTKKVIDFNRLPKQEYQKPVMEVIEADMEQQILAGSVDAYGMNRNLQSNSEDEVDSAW